MKWFSPLFALLVLAPWSITHVYAHSSNTADQDAVQIETTESWTASVAAAEDAITAPSEILPSHVYVLNNREIVTKETWREMMK